MKDKNRIKRLHDLRAMFKPIRDARIKREKRAAKSAAGQTESSVMKPRVFLVPSVAAEATS